MVALRRRSRRAHRRRQVLPRAGSAEAGPRMGRAAWPVGTGDFHRALRGRDGVLCPRIGADARRGRGLRAVWGSIYVSIAATLGATCAFLVGRYLARDVIARKSFMVGAENGWVDTSVFTDGGEAFSPDQPLMGDRGFVWWIPPGVAIGDSWHSSHPGGEARDQSC